jgi:hypothetical protein
MKLTRNTEWAIIAALIAYIAFTPGIQAIKDLLAKPLGKAAALALIVYVWKFVSPIIAILLTVSFVRCATWNVWEMFSGAEVACTCESPDATWDAQAKQCKTSTGTPSGGVKTCTCANGYAWDGGEKGTKQCVASSDTQPPVPPPAMTPEAVALASGLPPVEGGAGTSLGASAPATGGTAAPSAVPETTGSAAGQALAGSTSVATPASGGVQPGSGTTSTPASA